MKSKRKTPQGGVVEFDPDGYWHYDGKIFTEEQFEKAYGPDFRVVLLPTMMEIPDEYRPYMRLTQPSTVTHQK